jgi:23S rRNA (guanine745-N1)-methyltransferase
MFLAQYICPICQYSLVFTDKNYRCENNHSFDQAKEGYVNLLPVQHKHSKDPGDNKAMVNARRVFLDKGFYQPLSDELQKLYQQYGNLQQPVFDAGCGEGFYTQQYTNNTNKVYGIDIAKNAVRIAAKKYKDCQFSVGTLSQLPFTAGYFSWINSIYAPIIEKEFTRILVNDGYLLTVTPAKNHLMELKKLIYREAKQHDISKSPIEHLTLVEQKEVSYMMEFTESDDIINLLAMTPFAFKTTEGLLTDLKTRKNFSCQADFLIRLYQKSNKNKDCV